MQRKRQLRVLVAEDNPVSRAILERQLAELGLAVDTATNGREALEAITRSRYDAVFMDCHMPEMDGFETTRQIRRREAPGWRTPVIAVTATGAEAEEYLEAGMDEGLLKPIPPDQLTAVLARHLEGWHSESTPPPALVPEALENLRRIGQRRGSKALARLTNLCLTQIPERLTTLRQAVATGDGEAVEEGAHFVKGTARSLGAVALAERCAALEKSGKTGRLEDGEGQLAAIDEAYARLEQQLLALLAEHGEAAATQVV